MPIPTAAAVKVAGNGMMKSEHLGVVLAIVAGGALLLWAGLRASPGGIKVPARTTEDTPAFTPPPGYPVASVDLMMGGALVSPHRYPHVCGQEISALIKHGHATLRIPHARDIEWLVNPPGEVNL